MNVTFEKSPEQLTHEAYAQSLRKLADWIELHPEVHLPENSVGIYGGSTKEDFAKVAKAMKSFKKEYNGDMITITKEFGVINLSCVEYRNKVCERVVVGKQIVKEKKAIQFEDVEVEKEIIEWRCADSSLLETKE